MTSFDSKSNCQGFLTSYECFFFVWSSIDQTGLWKRFVLGNILLHLQTFYYLLLICANNWFLHIQAQIGYYLCINPFSKVLAFKNSRSYTTQSVRMSLCLHECASISQELRSYLPISSCWYVSWTVWQDNFTGCLSKFNLFGNVIQIAKWNRYTLNLNATAKG